MSEDFRPWLCQTTSRLAVRDFAMTALCHPELVALNDGRLRYKR